MSALLDFLKNSGAKAEDLESMRTMLENPEINAKFTNELKAREDARAAAEARARDLEAKGNEYLAKSEEFRTQAEAAKAREEAVNKWYTEQATPAYSAAMQDAIKSREYAAALEARLKAAEEYGFNVPKLETPAPITTPVTPPAPVTQPAPTAAADLPDLSQYSTKDDLMTYYSQAGDAIATAQNIGFQHQQLFGFEKPIDFMDLRKKAMVEKVPITQVWEREFDVPGRRAEIEQAKQAKVEAARAAEIEQARKEAREQALSEIGNPMTREPAVSRHPMLAFSARDRSGKQPWDKDSNSVQDRSGERAAKVLTTLARQNVA